MLLSRTGIGAGGAVGVGAFPHMIKDLLSWVSTAALPYQDRPRMTQKQRHRQQQPDAAGWNDQPARRLAQMEPAPLAL